MLAKARTEFCKISCTRAQSQRKASEFAEFHRLWVRSGILSPTARHETRQQYRTDLFTVDRPDVASPQATSVLCFATDGSGASDGKAGWGSSARRLQPGDEDSAANSGPALTEECGPVITSPSQPEFLGATRGTNNTGELSAVYHALTAASDLVKPGEEVLILADSRLAINTTLGVWAPRTNKAIVAANRRALAKLKARGIVVRFRHVRAHAGHFMNGRADSLARQGAQTLRMRDDRLFTPTRVPPPLPQRQPVDTVPD